jgi:kumamolisin
MPDERKSGPNIPDTYKPLERSAHPHLAQSKAAGAVDAGEPITVTLIVRRRPGAEPLHSLEYFQNTPRAQRKHLSHEEFAEAHGAAPADLDRVAEFAHAHALQVVEAHRARRSVVVRGTAAQVNKAFGVELHHYELPRKRYRGFEGSVHLPASISELVETVIGLDNRPVPAKRGPVKGKSADPAGTTPLTPQQVAQLYDFPSGNGAGQTIGIYEMVADDENGNPQNPGYTPSDLAATMKAFGGGLSVPTPTDVAIDGQNNAGVSDGETVLDITVSSAVAQGAAIAVYFTGGTVQDIILALQRMIHPSAGDPVPTVISISYGWGPDDDTQFTTVSEYDQIDQLFQDAAHLDITVLVSSGDSGAMIESKKQAQASFPATDPWVIACGGTTIGGIKGSTFVEYVWNDKFGGNSGATGGGISVRFPVPAYQSGSHIPTRIHTGTAGRGIPDIAGNASPNSGYAEFIGGSSVGPTGGTSAVAPLYAGLMALINQSLGSPAGFINPLLYSLAGSAFRDTLGAPGPLNNSFDGVTGYPANAGWDACTGLGSLIGTALLKALESAK